MEEKSFGNHYDHNATLLFFKRWWKVLLWVFIAAFAVSVVISLLIKPRYKSTAVLFPTSSNRLSKAILAERYSMDFLDYGDERCCEYAIQTLSSQSMQEAVCSHFNLLEHYSISPDDPHKNFKMIERYRGYVNVKRTDYLGVEIIVQDEDPQWAADIANYMTEYYDTLCRRIHYDRAKDAYAIMQGVCGDLQQEIFNLQDSLKAHPQHQLGITKLIEDKCQELAELQTRMTETKVDLDLEASYKFWVDQATPADKKAYPKRAVIVALGSIGAVVVCALMLLVLGGAKKEDQPSINQ